MDHPTGWLAEERITEARRRASDDRLARAARRAQGHRRLFHRVRGER